MKIIFLGTSSGAGKTTIVAMYCRYLRKKGIDVVPFKASNLSNNSFCTDSGKEIGVGQAIQAWASDKEPETDMNPILLKPLDGAVRVFLNGDMVANETGDTPADRRSLSEEAYKAFDRLCEKHQAVVCEGSGSPTELNIMDRDIANIGIMRKKNVPAVLVGDIERGGVFAAIYGTWLLMPEDIRPLLKGFMINRFRGDPSLLKPATDRISELTGMEYLGTMPYADIRFPEEDSTANDEKGFRDPMVKEAFLKDLDEFLEHAEKALDLEAVERISDSSA